MKRVLFFVAVATLFFSCQKELEPTNPSDSGKSFTFTAGIEKLATKADINTSNELLWAEGDKIGIFVNDEGWTDKNQPFTLESGAGSTTGKFKWDYTGNFSDKAAAAFFPWEAVEGDPNNVSAGTVYYNLPEDYYNYTSGQMFTPLIATLENSSQAIEFKHAGAAIKVTVNNLPAGAHSLGMTVDGQQVNGNFHMSVADAGDAAIVPNSADNSQNSLWLNIEPANAERAFTFLFPVPALTTPKFSFLMYDQNNVLVWKKNLKAQPVNVNRGQVLEMPAIDITPYAQFDAVSSEWTVIGTGNGANWDADIPMVTDGDICIAKGVEFAAGGKFRVRQNKAWDTAYPGGDYVVNEAGTYDIIFKHSDKTVTAVPSGCAYPDLVSLYYNFDPSRDAANIAFLSTDLKTAAWPGNPNEGTEVIGEKTYYKWSFPSSALWGKTISYRLVAEGVWEMSSSSPASYTFSTKDSEYYFYVDASKNVTELSKADVFWEFESHFDGVDWDNETWLPSEKPSYVAEWKQTSDADNLYIYFKLVASTVADGQYIYSGYDIDGDTTNGGSAGGNIVGNYDYRSLLYPFKTEGGEVVCKNGIDEQCHIKNLATGVEEYNAIETYGEIKADYAHVEMRIPRDKIGATTSGQEIISSHSWRWYITGAQAITLQ